MPVEIIQHLPCQYRDVLPDEEILYKDIPKEDQVFVRHQHPFTDDELDNLVDKTHQYTVDQAKWKELEEWRFENGIYAYINGKLKYIPGSYWCYINYWYLEDGEHPDYREDERLFAIFMEFCCFRSPLYGCTRPKGRRQGATSFGAFFEWFIAGRKEFQNCGTVSFNDDAAADVFVNMIMPGFKSMLPCFQADFDSPDDGKSFLRFTKPAEKKKKGSGARKRQGLNSLIDFKSLTLNSYTNKRLSFIMLDEFGRWAKLNCNLYWSKVSKALRKGKKKRGFAYMPTVVNPEDMGGGNYKRFYEQSDQRKFGMNTPTGCVIYVVYGTQCYAGCIDKYGESVIEDPASPIMGNDGDWITEGSRTIILRERALLDGIELMEHRRDYPIDEWDIFAFEAGQCEFNEVAIINQIRWCEENPDKSLWRQCRFYEEYNSAKSKREAKWADDPKGEWWLFEEPVEPNKFSGTIIEPENTLMYSGGADTYRNIFAIEGSDGVIMFFKKSCIINGVETGLYPVAIFVGRPRLIKMFNYQAYLGCLFFGCKINFEIDAGTWYYENFQEWDAMRLLEWEPARDPVRRIQMVKPGTESAQPFQLAKQLEVAKMYVDGTRVDAYNGNVHRITYIPLLRQLLKYNHSERTPYHLVVGLMMALLPVLGVPAPPPPPPQSRVLLRTYKVKLPH